MILFAHDPVPPALVSSISVAERLETDVERRKRLEDNRIIEPEVVDETPTSRLGRDVRKILNRGKLKEDVDPNSDKKEGEPQKERVAPPQLSAAMNFGYWRSLKAPSKTTFVEDYSHGIGFHLSLNAAPSELNRLTVRNFVGGSAVFYNGGVIVQTKDEEGENSQIYSDWTSTELGGVFGREYETSYSIANASSFGWKVSYAPVRWVRAIYNTPRYDPPKKSEGFSHVVFNWAGLGVESFYNWNLMRLFNFGAFVGVNAAAPVQLRFRAGLSVGLMALEAQN
jgi:hypothetical protein